MLTGGSGETSPDISSEGAEDVKLTAIAGTWEQSYPESLQSNINEHFVFVSFPQTSFSLRLKGTFMLHRVTRRATEKLRVPERKSF